MWNLPPLIDLTGQSKCTSTIKASSARATLKMQYGWIYWKIVQALDPDDASMWRSRVRPLWAPTTSQDGRRWISKRNRNQQPRWPEDRRLRLWGRTSRLGRQSRKPRCPFSLDTKTMQRQRQRQKNDTGKDKDKLKFDWGKPRCRWRTVRTTTVRSRWSKISKRSLISRVSRDMCSWSVYGWWWWWWW